MLAIANAHVLAAASADGAALQEGYSLARRRGAGGVIAVTVRREKTEVVLIALPRDVSRVSSRNAREPVALRTSPEGLLAFDRAAVGALPERIRSCVSRVA